MGLEDELKQITIEISEDTLEGSSFPEKLKKDGLAVLKQYFGVIDKSYFTLVPDPDQRAISLSAGIIEVLMPLFREHNISRPNYSAFHRNLYSALDPSETK